MPGLAMWPIVEGREKDHSLSKKNCIIARAMESKGERPAK